MQLKNNNAFTLVELLVVVSLIGVLSTLSVVNFRSATMKGRDAQRKSDLKNIQTALRLYYNDKAGYPATGGLPAWGTPWVVTGVTYMNTLPKDPLTNQNYTYTGVVGGEDYTLSSCLENKADTKCVTVPAATCSSTCQYSVKP